MTTSSFRSGFVSRENREKLTQKNKKDEAVMP
jgi:hypothetical protein